MKTKLQLDRLFGADLFDRSLYNGMLDIDEAKAVLGDADIVALAMREVRALFIRHDVQDFCGMTLLHRHWSVDGDELPVQTRICDAGTPTMVTQPWADVPEGAIAASWCAVPAVAGAGDTRLVPFEFSTDAKVADCAASLAARPGFFADAAETLQRHGLAARFGICIAMREPLSDDATKEWLEISDLDRRSVIVARHSSDYAPANLVQTVWIFAAEDGTQCVTACVQVQKCVQVYNGPDDFQHVDGGKKHERGHDKQGEC